MGMAVSLIFLYKVVRKLRQDADQMMRLRLTIVLVGNFSYRPVTGRSSQLLSRHGRCQFGIVPLQHDHTGAHLPRQGMDVRA